MFNLLCAHHLRNKCGMIRVDKIGLLKHGEIEQIFGEVRQVLITVKIAELGTVPCAGSTVKLRYFVGINGNPMEDSFSASAKAKLKQVFSGAHHAQFFVPTHMSHEEITTLQLRLYGLTQ